MSDEHSLYKFGRNDLHFALTDPTGRMISLDPLNGRIEVIENTVGIVTNAPKFDREIDKLSQYMDLDEQAEGLNHISTGNFSGKPVFPGGFTPTTLHQRLASKERLFSGREQ